MLTNSAFFSEAQFLANRSLKHPDAEGIGFKMAVNDLRYRRRLQCKGNFSDKKFDCHIEAYKPLVIAMINEYKNYKQSEAATRIVFEDE